MPKCDECGKEVNMPYNCRFCGGTYCSEHRLPENHSCDGLSAYKKNLKEEGKMFDRPESRGSNDGSRVPSINFNLSLPSALNGNVTYALLGTMVVTYLLQIAVLFLFGEGLHRDLFILSSDHFEYVWTWVTSIFAHAPPPRVEHIFINGLVLYFFGTAVERRIGSKRFLGLFLVSGVIAGLAQVSVSSLTATIPVGALGASGAIMATMGVLTVLNPNMRIYLYFFIPMPLWVATIMFAAYDFIFAAAVGAGAGGVGRLAHLSGLVLGLLYGWKLKREGYSASDRIRLSGRRRGF